MTMKKVFASVKAFLESPSFGLNGESEELQDSMLQAAESQDNSAPIVDQFLLPTYKGCNWWFLVSLNIAFLLVGQAVAVILSKLYYEGGGQSNWIATMVQTAAFPFLFLPILFLPSKKPEPNYHSKPPSLTLALVFTSLGTLVAVDNLLYSIGLLYLPMSTYSLLCASQLVFNAVLSKFINAQKFTLLIVSSVILLSVSASLIAVQSDSTESIKDSKDKHLIGFVTTILASALYALLLSLMQVSFERVMKKATFLVVLDMQIYTSLVATLISFFGLLVSGQIWSLKAEMDGFKNGKVVYVLSLVGLGVAWQVSSVGVVGLVLMVSSLFSNVISMLTLPLVPVAGFLLYGEDMGWIKTMAMVLAVSGCSCYFYQQYLDEQETVTSEECGANLQVGNRVENSPDSDGSPLYRVVP